MINRRIGCLFILTATLLIATAVLYRGIFWILVWPAMSFVIVGAGYLRSGIRVFRKQPNGSIPALTHLLLLPYLAYSWGVWHLLRLCLPENSYDELLPDVLIGRRLLPSEFPADVERVLDLTSEFAEPFAIRRREGYVCFAMLDASGCEIDELLALMLTLEQNSGRLYIHCAQGHGRTGLVAAAILLHRNIVNTTNEAIARIKSVRPGVKLNHVQNKCLNLFASKLDEDAQMAANGNLPESPQKITSNQ